MSKKVELRSFHVLNHSKCMMAAFQNFRQDETMLDVTLACNGFSLKAHKIVLSACSPYFKTLFADNPCRHPIVILKDVEFVDLKAIIDFMYRGELSVPRERLVSTLKIAEELQVRGLKSNESNPKDYEKLYKRLYEKQHQRKRRKKHQIFLESENNSASMSAESEQESSIQTDDSIRDSLADNLAYVSVPSVNTDFEKSEIEQRTSNQSKDVRPVVLRVGDPSVITNDHIKENADAASTEKTSLEDKQPLIDLEQDSENVMAAVENHTYESLLLEENASLNSPLDSFITCPEKSENSNVMDISVEVSQSDIQDMKPVVDINKSLEKGLPSCSKSQSLPVSYSESLSEATNQANQTSSDIQTKPRGSLMGYECHICGRMFTSRAVLLRHEVIIHKITDVNLPFKCHYCSFASKNASHLKSHMLIHAKTSPYKCSVCLKGFKTSRHLQQHSYVHTDEKHYSCGTCSSKFKRFSSLITHRRIHRRIMPFMCRYCCNKFFRGCDLLKHEKTCQDRLKLAKLKKL